MKVKVYVMNAMQNTLKGNCSTSLKVRIDIEIRLHHCHDVKMKNICMSIGTSYRTKILNGDPATSNT